MKNMILPALMLSAAVLAIVPASGQDGLPAGTSKNVVLVHGAFADEAGWTNVAALLTAKGYHVTAVKNPLTSLADDLAATQAVLDAQDGPTVLVGHSWGGVVIGEAGDDAKVSALVYVSAFAPDKGETLGALSASGPASEGLGKIVPDEKGFLSIDAAAFPKVFAGDLPQAEAEAMAANQLPINHTAFEEPAVVAAWHNKPSWYVITAEDLMLDAAVQGFFAERMGAKAVTVEGSHASYISHPDEIVAVIESAAVER